MAASFFASHVSPSNPGNGKHRSPVGVGQSLLNLLAASARRAADYSRMQGLGRRYLDDAGLTPAELDAAIAAFGVIGRREPTVSLAHCV